VEGFDDLVVQNLLNGYSLVWVEDDHLFNEVPEPWRDLFEDQVRLALHV
jgi:hypothetical protein